MPRPRKWRKVCSMPKSMDFGPKGCVFSDDESVVMMVDEYEAIRLIDYQGFTQEECSEYMKVARSTIQQIYTDARKKLSQSLVEAMPLKVSGGDNTLCDGKDEFCGCGGCRKHRRCGEF